MIAGSTFDELMAETEARAARMLPDAVVHVSDLRMTPVGHLEAPGMPRLRLNAHSRAQLSAQLGVRWRSWFSDAISGDERADEINRRLSRTPGELKIRAWKDDTGEAEGIARAFLNPGFSPIDNLRIWQRFGATLKGALDAYRFRDIVHTDATSHYTAVHVEARDVRGDVHFPGFHLRNSEVGGAAFTLDDFWLRLACLNGLLVSLGQKRLLYRTHRAIDDDHLAAAMVIALSKLPERWNAVSELLLRSHDDVVPHPDAAVASVLDAPEIPKALIEEAQAVVLKDNDRTRHGVVQAITYVAHAKNNDPEVRFAMERLAGDYLAAA